MLPENNPPLEKCNDFVYTKIFTWNVKFGMDDAEHIKNISYFPKCHSCQFCLAASHCHKNAELPVHKEVEHISSQYHKRAYRTVCK
jgi:hypothetical protein